MPAAGRARAGASDRRCARRSRATPRPRGDGHWINEHGGVAYLAHPYWTGVALAPRAARNRSGIEVYNAGCELEIGRGVSTVHWDELLDAGARASPSRPTTATIPGSTRTWHGPGSARADGRGRARRARARDASTAAQGHASTRSTSGAARRVLRPLPHVTVVFGRVERRRRPRGTPRLPLRRRDLRDDGETGPRRRTPRTSARAVRPCRNHRCSRRKGLDQPRMALRRHQRDATRAELGRAPYDLLVIGGGIIGAGIANEAARAGLRVALVDRSDFGGATSSASSKLIHGGLRYLRLGDVKLVREAHNERRALLRVVAPHLVRRIPFLFPVYRGGPYRPATIQAGLWTYRRSRGRSSAAFSVPSGRSEHSGASARGPPRLWRLPGCVDARRPPLPCQRDRGGRGGRHRPELRRGHSASPDGRNGTGRRGARSGFRRIVLDRGPQCRERHRAMAGDDSPPGGARTWRRTGSCRREYTSRFRSTSRGRPH